MPQLGTEGVLRIDLSLRDLDTVAEMGFPGRKPREFPGHVAC